MNKLNAKKVAGLLVTYFPESTFFANFNQYAYELDHWFIWDNGSDHKTVDLLEKLSEKFSSQIDLILKSENFGLAKAQNECLEMAIAQGYDFVYFLDQDSLPSPGSVKNLKSIWEDLSKKGTKVGWVGSQVVHPSGKVQKYWRKVGWVYRRQAYPFEFAFISGIASSISSGSLISKEVLLDAGDLEERFFIDYLDIEYCIRLRSLGYDIAIARDSKITHVLGNTESKQLLGISQYPTMHSPLRRYFMMRNRIWTWKKHFWKFPGWFAIDFGNFLYDFFRVLVFESEKINQTKALFYGLYSGLFTKKDSDSWKNSSFLKQKKGD